jgi:hypothetical protein
MGNYWENVISPDHESHKNHFGRKPLLFVVEGREGHGKCTQRAACPRELAVLIDMHYNLH